MADVFAANGYRTGVIGKWHLGDNYPYRPEDRGFQQALVHKGGGIGQVPDYWGNNCFNDTYFRNNKPEKFYGYCTDVWFEEAKRFVTTSQNEPFFLYLAPNAPHCPFTVGRKYSQPYLERGIAPTAADFFGMITNLDENMGRLLKDMTSAGVLENTIVIFTTDNGTTFGANHGATTLEPPIYIPDAWGNRQPFNAGMRGQKGSAYDGGHRVPCFIYWPSGGLQGGVDVGRLTAHIDLLPTLMDLAGLQRSDGPPLDGVSLVPLLKGQGGIRERSLVVQKDNREVRRPRPWEGSAVMTERWRLINGRELYDMDGDPGQRNDVSGQNAEVVSRLRTRYEEWYGDVTKRIDEIGEIVLGSDREDPVCLTAFDWVQSKSHLWIWKQSDIQRAVESNGFWAVQVARSGRYEFTLCERPSVAQFPIAAATANLQIGRFNERKRITPGATGVTFHLELEAGSAHLQTEFKNTNGRSRGAYYVYVRRL